LPILTKTATFCNNCYNKKYEYFVKISNIVYFFWTLSNKINKSSFEIKEVLVLASRSVRSGNSISLKKNTGKRIHYMLITLVLVILLLQIARGMYLNVIQYVVLKRQLNKLEYINQQAKEKNLELKKQLKDYTSKKGIEALARDNLQMVGKDEILVILKKAQNNPVQRESFKK